MVNYPGSTFDSGSDDSGEFLSDVGTFGGIILAPFELIGENLFDDGFGSVFTVGQSNEIVELGLVLQEDG